MKQNIIETLVGFIILGIALTFFLFAYKTGGNKADHDGYILKANFQSVDGVMVGSDVMISGIKVGEVTELKLDNNSFMAEMKLSINKDVKLPTDSQAIVASSGLLGGKFILIAPGADETNFKENDQIKMTQSSVNLESLIGKLIYSMSNK